MNPVSDGPRGAPTAPGAGGFLLLHRLAWASVSALALLLLYPLFHEPLGWGPIAVVVATVMLTVIRLHDGLLLLAAVGPLAAVTFVVLRKDVSSIRFEEALALGFLAGWAARRTIWPQRLPVSPGLRWSVALLAAAAVASAIVNGALAVAQQPDVAAREVVWASLVGQSLIRANPLNAAVLLIQGLLLLLAAADACGGSREKRDRVLGMMVLGAAAAAVLNLLRLIIAAAQHDNPWSTFLHYLATVRVNIHFADLNAAASYFAMMLFVALALVRYMPRLAYPSAALIGLGVWMSGSRVALAAVVITAALTGVIASRLRHRGQRAAVAASLVALGIIAVASWKWYPEERNVHLEYALSFRLEMAAAGLRMAAADPLWGVGVGRFQEASESYVSVPENAHNQFIQVLAELGVPGLVLFAAVIVLAARETWRTARPPALAFGLLAGLGAFLLTCLGGHPLLVPGAASPFWMLLGLLAAQQRPVLPPSRGIRLAALGVLVFFLVFLPYRVMAAKRNAYVEHASIGLSQWHWDNDGARYRWAGGRSTFFVAAAAQAVRIPLRHGPLAPREVEVRILVDGREADRVILTPQDGWRTVRLLLGRRASAHFRRIDVEAAAPGSGTPLDVQQSNSSGVLMIGRPTLH